MFNLTRLTIFTSFLLLGNINIPFASSCIVEDNSAYEKKLLKTSSDYSRHSKKRLPIKRSNSKQNSQASENKIKSPRITPFDRIIEEQYSDHLNKEQIAENIKNNCPILYNFSMAMSFCDQRKDIKRLNYMWFVLIYNDYVPFKYSGLEKTDYDHFKSVWPDLKKLNNNIPEQIIQKEIENNNLNLKNTLLIALNQRGNHCINLLENFGTSINKNKFEGASPYNYFLMKTADNLHNQRIKLLSELYNKDTANTQTENMLKINVNWAFTNEVWQLIKNSSFESDYLKLKKMQAQMEVSMWEKQAEKKAQLQKRQAHNASRVKKILAQSADSV